MGPGARCTAARSATGVPSTTARQGTFSARGGGSPTATFPRRRHHDRFRTRGRAGRRAPAPVSVTRSRVLMRCRPTRAGTSPPRPPTADRRRVSCRWRRSSLRALTRVRDRHRPTGERQRWWRWRSNSGREGPAARLHHGLPARAHLRPRLRRRPREGVLRRPGRLQRRPRPRRSATSCASCSSRRSGGARSPSAPDRRGAGAGLRAGPAARGRGHRGAHADLSGRGVEVSDVQDFPWGRFVFFSDPDGNGWAVQQIPPRP